MDGLFSKEEVLTFLKKRAGILEGVCITGGGTDPARDLEPFIREIRSLGLLVKLDTNGYRPDVLKDLCIKICWIMWQWILSQAGPGTPKQPASRVSTCHI